MVIIQILTAFILDRLLGEPKDNHPLVIFGNIANTVEKRSNHAQSTRVDGAASYLICVTPIIVATAILQLTLFDSGLSALIFGAITLYITIGWQSLFEHTSAIMKPLQQGNLEEAKQNLAMIVSRDTQELEEPEIVSATIETLLENGNDAIFGALFWFLLLGPVGAVLYRLTNTLDAMWGYKNERFLQFGWAAARLDDLLNWVPARLCAYSYALAGNYHSAMQSWKTQAAKWKSPNAGPVMAAGAGALSITIGGDAVYHGTKESKPVLGMGEPPTLQDIQEAQSLINKALFIWLATLTILFLVA
ncbi:adenosylcobinamide-phosphate synthase CbiB [Alkalimarinus coralli]|uniref:adenosylcobinamide-phosphate synthase CbiB n=1 Tax=Alkalimarinus coralli TaxID=2935863 RepID=UPI00202ACD37|nr:adenosylcobinamide-phosphate synthase CbiB [Alkalimarinus coralli]